MGDYQFNLPVNSEQLKAIGMVAAEWSYLESIIDAAIWSLVFVESDAGEAITAHLSLPNRLDMLLTLFHTREGDAEATKELRKLCDEVRHDLSGKRGRTIHTRWIEGEFNTSFSYSVRARGKLVRTKRVWPAPEIQAVAAEIAACSDRLQTFLQDANVVQPPWQQISG